MPFAEWLGMDFIWVHDAATVLEATLAHSLNSTGTPCLVVEMGVGQRINHKMCRRLVEGILHLMMRMGMWKGSASADLPKPIVCKGDYVILTELKCGINVSRGQTIGQIVNPLRGQVLSNVISPIDGYLFTIRAYPIVYEGSLMARIFRSEE